MYMEMYNVHVYSRTGSLHDYIIPYIEHYRLLMHVYKRNTAGPCQDINPLAWESQWCKNVSKWISGLGDCNRTCIHVVWEICPLNLWLSNAW